jgi:histone acetyltransferase (RNA polymerase elongator complex component)
MRAQIINLVYAYAFEDANFHSAAEILFDSVSIQFSDEEDEQFQEYGHTIASNSNYDNSRILAQYRKDIEENNVQDYLIDFGNQIRMLMNINRNRSRNTKTHRQSSTGFYRQSGA